MGVRVLAHRRAYIGGRRVLVLSFVFLVDVVYCDLCKVNSRVRPNTYRNSPLNGRNESNLMHPRVLPKPSLVNLPSLVPADVHWACYILTSNSCRLLVRGEDWSCKEAGMNVLVLSEDLDSAGEISKGFALQESQHAANRLADYLNHVPTGRTVRPIVLYSGECVWAVANA